MATLTLSGADVRSYYRELGIDLPDTSRAEVSVRCFADPGAHRREDRDPSCSVNVLNGAWRCHACGARGGAYDAALAKGHSPRSAIDLMISHGLTERRARLQTARELLSTPADRAQPTQSHAAAARPRAQHSRSQIGTSTAGTRRSPAGPASWRDSATNAAGTTTPIRALELGFDRGRITIPIRNARGSLRGLLRYQPEPTSRPKMLASQGSRLGLIPHPAVEASERVLLVEGPPDMIAARSNGLPAIAVPGDHAWHAAWATLLAGRQITIIMDADRQGRSAAQRIGADLATTADPQILELAPHRNDGYDLTDWLLEYSAIELAALPMTTPTSNDDTPAHDHSGIPMNLSTTTSAEELR